MRQDEFRPVINELSFLNANIILQEIERSVYIFSSSNRLSTLYE